MRIIKIKSNDDYFLVYLSSAADAENPFSEEVTYSLQVASYEPITSGELKASGSELLRGVDRKILRNSESSIKEEIINCNK